MTTKPKHTTTRLRHGAANRLNHRLSEQARLEKELRDALNGIPSLGNDKQVRLREYTVVTFTVRKDNSGLPRRWEYVAKPGTWESVAEHDARIAARKQGLVIHAHLETTKELRA